MRFTITLAATLAAVSAWAGATQTFYQVVSFPSNPAYFGSNVYLHDSATPLHIRINNMSITNRIVTASGINYTITNDPAAENDILAFSPASSTAYFTASGSISTNAADLRYAPTSEVTRASLAEGLITTNLAKVSTNYVPLTGNVTLTGPLFQNGMSATPASNEVPTLGYVRGMFNNGTPYYASTNQIVIGTVTNFAYVTSIPAPFTRTYTGLTNGAYCGVVIAGPFSRVDGPTAINSWLNYTGIGGNPSITLHAEIYFSYGTNVGDALFGDWDSPVQSLADTSAQKQWVVPHPSIIPTNPTQIWIWRKLKIDTVNNANLVVSGGTGTVSQISLSIPTIGTASATTTNSLSEVLGKGSIATNSITLRGASPALTLGAAAGDADDITITRNAAQELQIRSGAFGGGSATVTANVEGVVSAYGFTVGTNDIYNGPYQPYSAQVYPGAGATATITYAHGNLVRIICTNAPTTLIFDNSGYATNGVSRVAVVLWAGTNSVAFNTATITNATAPTISSTEWNSLLFRRVEGDAKWKGRQ